MSKQELPLASYDAKLEKLSRDILLSVRWDKPAIFWAIYENTFSGAKTVSDLEAQLVRQGQYVHHITPDVDGKNNIIDEITDNNHWHETVFFIMHVGSSARKDIYETLDSQSDFFTNNQIRVVYWLAESDFLLFVQHVPSFWFSQYKLAEFSDSPCVDYVLSTITTQTWQDLSRLEIDEEEVRSFETASLEELLSLDMRIDMSKLLQRAHIFIRLGIFYFRKGKFLKSSRFLNKANEIAEITKDKEYSLEVETLRALLLAKKEEYDDAMQIKKKCSSVSPKKNSTWNALGELYSMLFMFDEALSAYQASLVLSPEDPMSWQGMGEVFLQLGQSSKAINAFEKVLRFAPNFSRTWQGLGKAYLAKNNSSKAIHAYTQSLEIDWNQADIWFELGRLADDEFAEVALRRGLDLYPKNALAWNLLGNIYYRSQKFGESIQAYYQAVQLKKDSGWAYANMALSYARRKQYENATLLYIKALQILQDDQEKSNVLYKLGNAYRDSHKYRRAIAAYQEASGLYSGSSFLDKKLLMPGPFRAAVVAPEAFTLPQHENKDDNEPATKTRKAAPIRVSVKPKLKKGDENMMLRKVLETNKKARKVEYWLELGNHYVRNHLYDLAEDAFSIAVDLDPNNGWSYYNLALANTVNGAYRDAVPLYEKSIHLFEEKKDKASSWNQLGNVYRRLNEPSLAVAAYEKARVLDPPKSSSLLSRARLSLMSNCYVE
ncbi:MAG: tetratricopeptide repeat protein [Chloroflexi bacterium]|nr:tetratricopeptide repeat protein [Chloroflexota bacterium]